MKKTLLMAVCTAAVLFGFEHAYAQTNRVEVKKDFENDLTSARKSALKIDFSDTLKNFNLNLDYKILNKEFKDLYQFTPLPSARLGSKMRADYPTVIARLGLFFPFAPSASIYYQPDIFSNNGASTNTLTLKFEHNSFWGRRKLAGWNENLKTKASSYKAYAPNSNTSVGAGYGHQWKEGEFTLDVFYKRVRNSYYGIDANIGADLSRLRHKNYIKDNLLHTYNQGGVNFHIGSVDTPDYSSAFKYDVNIYYSNTSDKAYITSNYNILNYGSGYTYLTLNENYLKITAEVGPTIGKYSMVTLGVNSESVFYRRVQKYNSSLEELTLNYKMHKGRWTLNLGGRVALNFNNNSGTDRYHTYISPKVSVTYAMQDGKTWAYGIADGGNTVNSYSSLLEKCGWVFPLIQMRESSIPVIARVGIKGNPTANFAYDIYVGAGERKGMLQFAGTPDQNYASSALTAIYSNHQEMFAGFAIDYKTDAFAAGAQARYTHYTEGTKYRDKTAFPLEKSKPAGYPPFEGNAYAQVNIRDRITFGASLYARSSTQNSPVIVAPGITGTRHTLKNQGYVNLGLYTQYAIDRNFTAFFQISNLLNRNIINYGMYMESGISGGAGVLVKF